MRLGVTRADFLCHLEVISSRRKNLLGVTSQAKTDDTKAGYYIHTQTVGNQFLTTEAI